MTEDVHVMEEIWIPDLEIYGLEDFGSKKVLKEMSGLRIKKNKTLEYNARYCFLSFYKLIKFHPEKKLCSEEVELFL